MGGVSGPNSLYLNAMVSDLQQKQGQVLMQLFQVAKDSVMTEASPMRNISPRSANMDVYA